jgi:beta-fructofuranosidase
MHATSKDRFHWVKHPQDTILPGANYRGNDFRDPHVVWVDEKKEYWMLITTRSKGRGIIARYSSTDLKTGKTVEYFLTTTPSPVIQTLNARHWSSLTGAGI